MTLQHRESRKRGKEESARTLSPSEQPSRGTRASARLAAANGNGDGNTHTRPTADEHPQRARLPRDSNLLTRACPNASTTIMNTPSYFHPTLYRPKKKPTHARTTVPHPSALRPECFIFYRKCPHPDNPPKIQCFPLCTSQTLTQMMIARPKPRAQWTRPC